MESTETTARFKVGDGVRIERDETRWPPKGTWPNYRGATGTIVEVNTDREHQHLNEYGVTFTNVTERTDGRGRFNWDAKSGLVQGSRATPGRA